MSTLQQLVLRLAGARAADIESESRSWMARCSNCAQQHSYWDLGGIRFRASSVGKKIRITCPACQTRGWAEVSKAPPSA